MIKIYSTHKDDNDKKCYKDFKRLDDDISNLSDLTYRDSYREIASNFENIIKTIKPRNR